MKKGLLALILTGLLLITTGCGKKDSPETAVEGFFNACIKGDMDNFKKYSTNNTQQVMLFGMAMSCSKEDLQNNPSKCLKQLTQGTKEIKVLKVNKIDDKHAEVTFEEVSTSGKKRQSSAYVVKTDDGWKVDVKK